MNDGSIRCKDCIYWDERPAPYFEQYHLCTFKARNKAMLAMDYCDNAKRKKEIKENEDL